MTVKEATASNKRKVFEIDTINKPPHYVITDNLEAIDIIDKLCEINSEFLKDKEFSYYSQCLQYLFRTGRKNKLEDLRKAEWYLKRLIVSVEKRQ